MAVAGILVLFASLATCTLANECAAANGVCSSAAEGEPTETTSNLVQRQVTADRLAANDDDTEAGGKMKATVLGVDATGLLALFELDESDGSPVDGSPNSLTAIRNSESTSWASSGCHRGGCLSFVGSANSKPVEIQGLNLESSWSISMWLKPVARDVGQSNIWFYGKGYFSQYTFFTHIRYTIPDIFVNSPPSRLNVAGGLQIASVELGLWHHLVVTRDSTTGLINGYWNGINVGSYTGQTGDMPAKQPGDTFILGDIFGAHDSAFHGSMDDVSVWSRVLSASEIDSMFTFQA